MIIRSSKALKSNKNTVLNNFDEKPVIVNEEVKPLDNEIIQRPKKKKNIPTPVAVEEPIVVEEKTEDEDLSKWLKEHTED